jgi:uncharacterized membrane protein
MHKVILVLLLLVVLILGAASVKVAMTMNDEEREAVLDQAEENHTRGAIDDFEDADRIQDQREESVEEARERIRKLTGRAP